VQSRSKDLTFHLLSMRNAASKSAQQLNRNARVFESTFALAPDLESMLLASALKILCKNICLLSQCGNEECSGMGGHVEPISDQSDQAEP
jgi:hypothetical protein